MKMAHFVLPPLAKCEMYLYFSFSVPPSVQVSPKPAVALQGEPFSLNCSAPDGTLPLVFSWTHNGGPLSNRTDVALQQGRLSILYISNFNSVLEAGEYICNVTVTHLESGRSRSALDVVTVTVAGMLWYDTMPGRLPISKYTEYHYQRPKYNVQGLISRRLTLGKR